MAAVGVSLFDLFTTKFVPQTSALVRVGVKAGGAFLFQSSLGSKVPFLGKYKNEIALVLGVSAGVDLIKLYVMPVVANTLNAAGINLIPVAVTSGDGTTGDLWNNTGNAGRPRYQPWA